MNLLPEVCPGFIHEHRHRQLQQLNGQFHVPGNQAAMFYDPYNNVAGLGGYPALTFIQVARGRFFA